MSEEERGGLPDELRALGRRIPVPDVDGQTMAERVLAQLLAESVPVPVAASGAGAEAVSGAGAGAAAGARGRVVRVRRWARRRWRALVAALSGLLVVLALTPPVRAAVVDWFGFGFGGVEVRYDPSAPPPPGPDARGADCGRPVSLAEAERRAGFDVLVPDVLGAPDVVSVSGAGEGRWMVSLCWRERKGRGGGGSGGAVRLDEFGAGLSTGFTKTLRVRPQWVEVAGESALWFRQPHLLSFRLSDPGGGGEWVREERTAGPTLLWTRSGAGQVVTLRLEGVAELRDALGTAESAGSPGPGRNG
ncbi:hypothetical protein [Streptomyces sp. NPDC050504]|uniref:hypothetical protein n=1 Tax=Streptomyces sp. NPDC050504 TaxID=3365618 RepID=UPI003789FE80